MVSEPAAGNPWLSVVSAGVSLELTVDWGPSVVLAATVSLVVEGSPLSVLQGGVAAVAKKDSTNGKFFL